jgi:hypothetical protein
MNANTVKKYHAFLVELKELCESKKRFVLADVIKRNSISKAVYSSLGELKIITTTGERKSPIYTWNQGEPTLMMARKILESCHNHKPKNKHGLQIKSMTNDMIYQIQEMRDSGKTYREIGNKLNVSAATAWAYYKRKPSKSNNIAVKKQKKEVAKEKIGLIRRFIKWIY